MAREFTGPYRRRDFLRMTTALGAMFPNPPPGNTDVMFPTTQAIRSPFGDQSQEYRASAAVPSARSPLPSTPATIRDGPRANTSCLPSGDHAAALTGPLTTLRAVPPIADATDAPSGLR